STRAGLWRSMPSVMVAPCLSCSSSCFCSSRRRHTRSKRDWSSDVCSSDLGASPKTSCATRAVRTTISSSGDVKEGSKRRMARQRSEERRVGKEGRARRGTEQYREMKYKSDGGPAVVVFTREEMWNADHAVK